jgi:PII-like signaling protein
MKSVEVTVVRIYLVESSNILSKVLEYLHHEVKVRGVSVFRAVSGFGDSGEHTSRLIDLSVSLPITIEFFDLPEKAKTAIEYLSGILKPEHMIFWTANSNDN